MRRPRPAARSTKWWRVQLALLAVLVAAAGIAAGNATPRPLGRGARIGNLQIERPRGWSMRPIAAHCGEAGPALLLSDLPTSSLDRLRRDLKGMPRGSCTTLWAVSGLPTSYTLLDLTEIGGPFSTSETKFPIKYANLPRSKYQSPSDPRLSCRCTFRAGTIRFGGRTYDLRTWLGRHASVAGKRSLVKLVASIRPSSG